MLKSVPLLSAVFFLGVVAFHTDPIYIYIYIYTYIYAFSSSEYTYTCKHDYKISIPHSWMSNLIPSKVWDEITCTVEIWEWICNSHTL